MKHLTDNANKINKKSVKSACVKRGLGTITELAKQVPCSLTSIYFAMERPSRYPRVFARIRELTGL